MRSASCLLLPFIGAVSAQGAGAALGWAYQPNFSGPWPHQTFLTEPTIQPPAFKTNATGATGEGAIFMAIQNQKGGALIVSPTGSVLWAGGNGSATNLTPATLKGKPVMVAWNGTAKGAIQAYGSLLVFDDSYEMIHNVLLQDPDFGTDQPSYIDSHEAYLTDKGTAVVTAALPRGPVDLSAVGGAKDGYFVDCGVFEIDVYTNKVLFKWWASEHQDAIPQTDSRALPFGSIAGYSNSSSPWDPYHMNSVQAVDDGYIFSLRHFSTIYHLSKNGTVTWQIHGTNNTVQKHQDFTMGPNTTFSWQHDARVAYQTNSSLILHLVDNANWQGGEFNTSYGVQLAVDLQKKTVTEMLRLSDDFNPQSTYAGGSLSALGNNANGHWLMSYGILPVIKEFDSAGTCIFTMQFGSASYRAFRSEWHGYPNTKPKVAACLTSDPVRGQMTRIHASWNGATEVTGWSLFAGQSASNSTGLTKMLDVAKMDFETVAYVQGAQAFVQVQSIGGGRAPQVNVTSDVVPVNGTCA
ncbi:hypothetical protein MCOR13_006506 [Pyricularia oryzae]|nr:hypothetical protein MCOR13_006506 [Pyricularia oryzae]